MRHATHSRCTIPSLLLRDLCALHGHEIFAFLKWYLGRLRDISEFTAGISSCPVLSVTVVVNGGNLALEAFPCFDTGTVMISTSCGYFRHFPF